MYSCMPKKVQNQKMTKKMYCIVIIFVIGDAYLYCLYILYDERISTSVEICILGVPGIYLCGNYCKFWNLFVKQC